jgi:hypothetical protein
MSDTKWPRGPYILATSCSWRRFLTESGESVCVPCKSQADGHPDLIVAPGVGPLFEAAPDMAEALKPFSQSGFQDAFGGNVEGDDSPIFERQGCRLTLGDFRRAFAALAKARGETD